VESSSQSAVGISDSRFTQILISSTDEQSPASRKRGREFEHHPPPGLNRNRSTHGSRSVKKRRSSAPEMSCAPTKRRLKPDGPKIVPKRVRLALEEQAAIDSFDRLKLERRMAKGESAAFASFA